MGAFAAVIATVFLYVVSYVATEMWEGLQALS